MTTPFPLYKRIGLSTQYCLGDDNPIFEINLAWPGKQIGLNLGFDWKDENQLRGRVEIRTPFPKLQSFVVNGSYSLPHDSSVKSSFHRIQQILRVTRAFIVSPQAYRLNVGTIWNEVEFAIFNATFYMESPTNGDFFAHIETSIPGHDRYGVHLTYQVDVVEYPSMNGIILVDFPSNQVNATKRQAKNVAILY